MFSYRALVGPWSGPDRALIGPCVQDSKNIGIHKVSATPSAGCPVAVRKCAKATDHGNRDDSFSLVLSGWPPALAKTQARDSSPTVPLEFPYSPPNSYPYE